VGGLPRSVERHNDGESHGDFGRSNRDDEKYQHLSVVIRKTVCTDVEAGEGDERQIGGIEHQLKAHENGDNVATQQNASKADGKQQPACEQIMIESQRSHKGRGLLEFTTGENDDPNGGHEYKDADCLERQIELSEKRDADLAHIIQSSDSEWWKGILPHGK